MPQPADRRTAAAIAQVSSTVAVDRALGMPDPATGRAHRARLASVGLVLEVAELEAIFGVRAIGMGNGAEGKEGDTAVDEVSKEIETLLLTETTGRERCKALCYEGVLIMIVRHPIADRDVLTIQVMFVHHKGAENMPKP